MLWASAAGRALSRGVNWRSLNLKQGKRTLIVWKEHFGEIDVVPTRFEPLDLDTPAGSLFLAQQTQGEMAQHGKVLRAVVAAHATGVFAKRDIEPPMPAILNPPVTAHGMGKLRDIPGETRQVVAPLDGGRLPHCALRFD